MTEKTIPVKPETMEIKPEMIITVPASKLYETKKTCPSCFSDRFQRHERGHYYDGKFVQDQEVCQCVGCLRVYFIEELIDKDVS